MTRRSTKNVAWRTTLPWGASALLDSLVGTIYGPTRGDVLRFIAISWIHNNAQMQREIRARLRLEARREKREREKRH